MQVDVDGIVGFEFVGDGAVTYAGDHGCKGFALFYEVFRADWVVEPFTDSNIGEFDTSTKWRRGHKRNQCRCESVEVYARGLLSWQQTAAW
jgi:hypothetical protein